MNNDLGKEFWGMLLFETHIAHLHQLLNVRKYNRSLQEFVDWIVFPDSIPLNVQKSFVIIMRNRFRLAQYHDCLSFSDHFVDYMDIPPTIRPLTIKEKNTHSIATELLMLKYQNKHVRPQSFHAIYNLLSYNSLSFLLNRFIEGSYIDRYQALDYLIHYKKRECAN